MIALVVVIFLISLYAVFITAVWWIQKQQSDEQSNQVEKLEQHALESAEALNEAHDEQIENASSAMLATADEARRLHQTLQKFVPKQFVEHFSLGGAESLALGYANEDEVAIMFCDIRGFTSLSEQMSPQQLMNFLNSYFLRMNAPIHDNHGFIDKFIGDAIMALFDHPNGAPSDKATDSVRAALDLHKALRLYNQHRANSGYEPVKNGIGLHYGPVIIGTVGSDDRMDTTVLGDAVNIAQRIESLTKYFDLDILASKSLVDEAAKQIEFEHRIIDKVVLKGKSSSIEVVEIFDHMSSTEQDRRNASKDIIIAGINMRNSGDFAGAISLFKKSRTEHFDDPVIEHHIKTCERLMLEPDWDGKIRL